MIRNISFTFIEASSAIFSSPLTFRLSHLRWLRNRLRTDWLFSLFFQPDPLKGGIERLHLNLKLFENVQNLVDHL
jgi:hypothetical protein